MSRVTILIVFLTVLVQLRVQGDDGRGRWMRYGVPPRAMTKIGTGPRPLLSAPSNHVSPQTEGTLNGKTVPGVGNLGPVRTYPGIDFEALKRRNAEFESMIAGIKSSLSDMGDTSDPFGPSKQSDPFGPPDPSKSRVRIPIADPSSRTLSPSPSPSGRFSDPSPLSSPSAPSYTPPSPPTPPSSQAVPFSPWLRNRIPTSLPTSPTPPPTPRTSSPPVRQSTSPSYDPAPPASCAASNANATPSISRYGRKPSFKRNETLPNDIKVEPNIMEPYPSSKPSTDSKPSDPGTPSTAPRRFYGFGNTPNRQYNGAADTKRYGGSAVVSDKLPNDAGDIEIKISGRSIDDDRMSQMIKEAQNAITTVFYYPLHMSVSRGTVSFRKVQEL